MLAQDLFESSPSSQGQKILKQLQDIAGSGQDGNLTIGVDMMPIQGWQATYLMGIYKALNQRYGVDRALSMMGNYDFIDRALERQEAKLASMSRVGSVPGERGVTGDVPRGLTESSEESDIVNSGLSIKFIEQKLQEAGLEKEIRKFLQWAKDSGAAYMDDALDMGAQEKFYDPEISFGFYRAKKLFDQDKNNQLDEIGDTPAGQAALQAVGQRADDTMAAWASNPKSGYSSTPSAVAKASQAGVSASNRLYGFGPDKSKVNTVMARDALRQQQAQRGMAESMPASVIKSKQRYSQMTPSEFAQAHAKKTDDELRSMAQRHGYGKGSNHYVEKRNKGKPDMVEEVKLPYPEGSENLGRANMELLIKAFNEPTGPRTVLQFGGKTIELDRQDIEAIADYYDDKLPDNAARWNFIRTVMNSHDNLQDILHKIGRRSAASIRQPGLFQEASKKKDDDELGAVRDVSLQRAITKAKADFPTAGSGLEALAKDFMQSQEQDRRDFDQLQTAKRRHDQLLSQISKVDQEQQQEIQDLEDQNSTMSQRLQQLQRVNAELEKKLAAMTGRRDQRAATPKVSTAGPSASASTPASQDVVVRRPPKPRTKKDTKPKAIKIRPSAPAIGTAPETPKLPAPDTDNILPPMFKRPLDPEFARGKETATDIEIKEPAQIRATATAESSKSSRREADYGSDYQDMVRRVGQMAQQGPRKTVWDPVKKVYKTVPIDPPKKMSESNSEEYTAIKTVSDWAERLRVAKELQRDTKLMSDPEAKSAVQQRINDLLDIGIKQGYMK